MNFKIVSEQQLAAAVAESIVAACPAGTVGVVYRNEDRRRAIVKALAEKGITAVYRKADGEDFPEYARYVVAEGGRAERAAAGGRLTVAVSDDATAELLCEQTVIAVFFLKEGVEERAGTLAITALKTLLLTFLSAADTALWSVADVSGEDRSAFVFLQEAAAFFREPPVKQNYLQRLLNLLKSGAGLLKEPYLRLDGLTAGTSENGFQMLYFMLVFLYKTARLPFLSLFTVGQRQQQSLYFLEEYADVVPERILADDTLRYVARHLRLLVGTYAFADADIEKGFGLLRAAVRESDTGYLSSLKKEGILSAFVKYPL